MSRIDEQDELLLNRLLDGDLPADAAAELRGRIDREPALRAVWERLARIDRLLLERRADACEVDWGRFHRSVISRIDAHAAPAARVIRFPWWLSAAVPLAVAAAVAIVFVLRTPHEEAKPGVVGPGVIQVAYHAPRSEGGSPPGAIVVRFHRPEGAGGRDLTAVQPLHVAYLRSSEMEEEIRKADMGRENQPSSHLYIMHADGRALGSEVPSEPPPL
jgi:hypothetical protein